MYTARRRGPRQEDDQKEARSGPPDSTPADAAKQTFQSLRFLAKTLWDWTHFFSGYVRLDVLLAVGLGFILLPWLARRVVGLVIGRMLLPSVFGTGYEESKAAWHDWISTAIDRLIPPPGIDEGRAGEGIVNTLTGGGGGKGGEAGGWWWKPQVGALVIRGVRWAIKHVLGVQ